MPKFSIITPCYYDREDEDNKRQPRYEMFLRCAKSVHAQTFEDWEWLIGDDISRPSVDDVLLESGLDLDKIVVTRLSEKSGRIGATNAALDVATGDWICLLDADDEYASIYLEAIDKAIKTYPDYEMFNFNHLIFSYDFGTSIRKFLDVEKIDKRPFGSGSIGLGAFVVKKTVLDTIERLPVVSLWDLRDWFFERNPEVKEFFWNNNNKDYNSLGNPWGNDYAMFYMLIKKLDYKCKYLDTALYYVHSHYGHRWPEDPDYLMGEGKKPEWNKNLI